MDKQELKDALLRNLTLADVEELVQEKWKHEAPREIDLNRPPVAPYVYREFPKLLYNHENGRVVEVNDAKSEARELKSGFRNEPSDRYDYTMIRNGKAPTLAEASAERDRQERAGVMQVEVVGPREGA